MISFRRRVKAVNGIFFVTKKVVKGKPRRLRMILDCRTANKFFRRPPRTLLGSIEALSRLRLSSSGSESNGPVGTASPPIGPPGTADLDGVSLSDAEQFFDSAFIAQDDVRDFFFRIGVEDDLSEWFGLPEVSIEDLCEVYLFDGEEIPDEIAALRGDLDTIHPALDVLPMGWSWSFHLAQCVHEHLASVALPEADRLVDRRPVPDLAAGRSCLMLYADNGNHLGLSQRICEASRVKLAKVLNDHNLKTHETVHATSQATTLGVAFDGHIGLVRTTPERDAQLDQSLLAVISGTPIGSEGMRRLVGHITCRLLLRRPLLSTLHYVYKFINANVPVVKAWQVVIDELRMIRGLLVFCFSNLRSTLSCRVTMTDACLSGYGVGESDWSFSDAKAVCSYDERWRFKEVLDGETHRQKALREHDEQLLAFASADVLTDVRTAGGRTERAPRQLQEDFSFPNVPSRLLRKEDWRGVWACPLKPYICAKLVESCQE